MKTKTAFVVFDVTPSGADFRVASKATRQAAIEYIDRAKQENPRCNMFYRIIKY
jgi:hypothetical protein